MPGHDRDELETKLDDVDKRWNDVKRKWSDHVSLVGSVLEEADKYQDAAEYLGPWLASAENEMASLEPIVADQSVVADRESVLDALREDIERHRPDRVIIYQKSNLVIGRAQADQEVVGSEAANLLDRFDKVDATCCERREELERVLRALEQYHTALRPVNQVLGDGETVVSSLGLVSGDLAKLRKELQTIKVSRDRFTLNQYETLASLTLPCKFTIFSQLFSKTIDSANTK